MSTLDTVYHVGYLDQPRKTPYFSYEGDALSVSKDPDAWIRIAELSGYLYRLSKRDPRWFYALGAEHVVNQWSVQQDFLVEAPKYRVYYYDSELDGERYFEFVDREDALTEAEDWGDDARVERVTGYVLGTRGVRYVIERLQGNPATVTMPEMYAPLWYAEAHDYDGVWWDEVDDPAHMSAPRGAIFQSSLPTWSIKKEV